MPIELVVEPFSAATLAKVANLNCGNDEHGRIATNWIQCTNAKDSALSDIQEFGTEVFLYYEQPTNRLVGFGSLGISPWDDKKGGKVYFGIIPHIGIDIAFHGYPPGAPWQERPSALVMIDLMNRAAAMPPTDLTLYVHKDNLKARKLYDRLGFRPIGNVNRTDHQRMIIQVR